MQATTLRLAISEEEVNPIAERCLRIFLRDHLAALHGAIGLVRRSLNANRDDHLGAVLAPIHVSLQEDLVRIEEVLRTEGVRPSRVKIAAAKLGEKLGRFKLNGRVVQYSPLSRICELEGLIMFAAARAVFWRILERRAKSVPALQSVDCSGRADLAEHQQALLARAVVDASDGAF